MNARESVPTSRRRALLLLLAGHVAVFAWPLVSLLRFALANDLYSHVLLIPVVSTVLAWQKRDAISASRRIELLTALPFYALGVLMLIPPLLVYLGRGQLAQQDLLACSTLAFLLLGVGHIGLLLGRSSLWVLAFPLGFLVAMVPFPVFVQAGIERTLQHGSAEAAYWLFRLAGTPVLRDGTLFRLPGINLEVAPQCSGIRSSLVLAIVSALAAQAYLRSWSSRVLLVLMVLPLAVARNGLRVFVLGLLCVHISPAMIHSWIHHQGGPVFFALSLIPFATLLWGLIRWESRRRIAPPSPGGVVGVSPPNLSG